MAPPAKAPKSDVTLKVYDITKELRRNIDLADRDLSEMSVTHLHDALAEARKLERYLNTTIENKLLLLAGGGGGLYTVNGHGR